MKKKVLLICIIVICLVLGILSTLLALEYNPEEEEPLSISGTCSNPLQSGANLDVITWNIGYCGLGEDADFFIDGGKGVHPKDKATVENNLMAVTKFLKESDIDLALIQEIDKKSTRTRKINQVQTLEEAFEGYNFSYANNLLCAFIPYPVPPLGTMNSGIFSISKYQVSSAKRIALPVPFKWPIRAFNLKRCLLENRIPIENSDKELILVNLHLEAYDSGEGKIAQTNQLAEYLKSERNKGKYVIAGGDFNQIFSNVDTSKYAVKGDLWSPGVIDTEDFGANLSLLMDDSIPTCRSLDSPYDKADPDFQYYLIDGFIVSDNVKVNELSNINLDFENSDHNPVKLNVTLE